MKVEDFEKYTGFGRDDLAKVASLHNVDEPEEAITAWLEANGDSLVEAIGESTTEILRDDFGLWLSDQPTQCAYWTNRRGYKCGRCDACCDEGDRILQARKDGD
jgi:hypothetical protein